MRRVSVLLAALLALAVSGCGGNSATPPKSVPGKPDAVNVGVIAIIDVAPIYLGDSQGFFKKRNIDLKLTPAQGGAVIVPGVVSGQYQFGFSNMTSLLIAQTKGLPLKVVANGNASTGVPGKDFCAVVVRGDSTVKNAADLAGRNVAVNNLKNIADTTVRASIRNAGGDAKAVKFTELAFPDMQAALDGGRVDGIAVVEPFLSAALAKGGRVVSSPYADAAANLTVAAYFTSKSMVQGNPDLVRRFTEAMQESLAYADSHPDDVRSIIGTYTQIAPDLRAKLTLPKFPRDVNRDSVRKLADLALGDGLLTSAPDLDQLLPQ